MVRPLSVSVISWYTIISSSLAIFSIVAQMIANLIPDNFITTLPIILGTLFLNILSAILMLKGYRAGRILYTLLALTTVYSAFQSKDNTMALLGVLGGMILAIIFLVFLYRENADQFFLRKKLKQSAQPKG